jgi:hypothetical protein
VEALKAEGWTLCVEQLPDASKQIVNVVFGDGLFCCMHEIPPADHVVAWRMPLPPIVYEVRV